MQMNGMAAELSAWALGSLGGHAATHSAQLHDGWELDPEGALLLRSQIGSCSRTAGMDLTGFEALHNHLHIRRGSTRSYRRPDLYRLTEDRSGGWR